MVKQNKVARADEEKKSYATSVEMDEVKRSIEAHKKTKEDNNLQMDKLVGLMANFMNDPANRNPLTGSQVIKVILETRLLLQCLLLHHPNQLVQ